MVPTGGWVAIGVMFVMIGGLVAWNAWKSWRHYRDDPKVRQVTALPDAPAGGRLSVAAMAAHAGRLSYKPGWELEVYEGRWEGPHLRVRTLVPNTYGGGMVELDVHTMVPPMRDLEQFEEFVAWRLARIEVHEAREFLKRDGRVLFDPHARDADRDLA